MGYVPPPAPPHTPPPAQHIGVWGSYYRLMPILEKFPEIDFRIEPILGSLLHTLFDGDNMIMNLPSPLTSDYELLTKVSKSVNDYIRAKVPSIGDLCEILLKNSV